MNQIKFYGDIAKIEDQPDGTLKVYGYASTEAVDADGEIVRSSAIKGALDDYMKFGAVREMHQAKAAGTAIEARVEPDGKTFFGAHVVDSEAVKKVKHKVYKGFSIGGNIIERDPVNKNEITQLKLVEISLVDRPANPEAVFCMYKAEDSAPDVSLTVLRTLQNVHDMADV
ncbi:MAG: HK97 family phage prohead protease, partial [Candidatus Saccharimonadales bacterium]